MSAWKNRRNLERFQVGSQIDVINQVTGQFVGSVVNLHTEGLLLMANEQLEANCIYQVLLEPRGRVASLGDIELGIDCLWVRDMEAGASSWAGCRIIDASADAIANIEQLIVEFGMTRGEPVAETHEQQAY